MKRRLIPLLLLAAPMLAVAATGSTPTSTSQLLSSLFRGCWACGVFNTVGAIGLSFADTVFTDLASAMKILIGLGIALWVLFFAAKLFLPFGPPGSAHWNLGAAKVLKLLLVLAFLEASGPFWDYIFTPILSMGMSLASTMASATDKFEASLGGTTSGVPTGSAGTTSAAGTDYCAAPAPAPPSSVPLSNAAQQGLTALEQMDCPLSRMQSQYGKGILIGVAAMGQMGCSKSWLPNLIPSNSAIAVLAAGLILVGVYLFGYLVFPFLLIDVIARVILVAAISPLAIASILFKPTQHIGERLIWSLVHAGLTLMFGATIAGIGKALIAYILNEMATTGGGAPVTDWTGLQSALDNSCQQGFTVDFSTASFYMLVGTGIITIFMMRRASALATELTHISGSTGAQAGFAAVAGAAGKAAGTVGRHLVRKVTGI